MLHQPALEPAEEGPAKGRPVAVRREAWCLMLSGTWQLVSVVGWQHDGRRWRCLLQWGVQGTVYEGWYLHDPDKLAPVNSGLLHPVQPHDVALFPFPLPVQEHVSAQTASAEPSSRVTS
jgi:hypothetical protein